MFVWFRESNVVSLLYATKSALAFTAPNLCWACALASSVTFLTGDHIMQIGFGQISPSASSTRDLGTRLQLYLTSHFCPGIGNLTAIFGKMSKSRPIFPLANLEHKCLLVDIFLTCSLSKSLAFCVFVSVNFKPFEGDDTSLETKR